MRYLLPIFRPGELLGGWWIRAVRRIGLPVSTVARLAAGRDWIPGFLQVAQCSELASELSVRVDDLLWQHTVFPYATAFFKPDVYNKAVAAAKGSGKAATGMGAVTQSVSEQVRYRRFCVACACEDQERWGESYWHREHHLPGVVMCLKHGTALRGTSLATSGHNVWADSLPHELRGQQLLRRPLSAFDRELAARSVAVLNRPAGEQLDRDGHWYRRRLLELGMLSEGRQVNVDKLKVWFRTSGVASPAHYGFSMKSWELSWLAFLLRPGSNQPHIPLKHLLLETALALQAPVTEPLVEHVPKGPSGRDTARRDKEYAAAVQKVVAAYVRRGERLRVSDVLTQVGCFGSFRHAPAAFPRTAKAVAALKASTAACRPNWGKGLQADFTDPKEVNRRS
jgi:hypothetical protein